MLKILLSGCNGRMGRFITQLTDESDAQTIVAGIDVAGDSCQGFPVYQRPEFVDQKADVLIDFSNPSLLSSLLEFCVARKMPAVFCTTGYSDEQILEIKKASEIIPIFFSFNMSIGINLLISLAKTAAQVLGNDFDIEIVEKHHNQKLDAPSGTALMIAGAINEVSDGRYQYEYDRHARRAVRPKNEIGIHSIRGGTIVGEHKVIFAGTDETLSLTHIAGSRNAFAAGALRAAEFLLHQTPGLYDMNNLIQKSS